MPNQDPILAMLHDIDAKLTTIQTDMRDMKENQSTFSQKIEGLQFDQEDGSQQLKTQQADIKNCQDKVDLLANLVIKYEEKMEAMSDKITLLENKTMKAEMLIFGLEEKKEQSCVQIVSTFFKDEMQLENIELTKAFWKGKSNNKPMFIMLADPTKKSLIYSKVSNLKDKKNSAGESYRIRPSP